MIDDAPGLTLTDGHAALHQAIVGDRLRLTLDAPLSRAVTGAEHVLAHPALVWDVAIGQSTTATQRVIANLFYPGLVFHRAPLIGDTLRTRTEVVALRQTSPGRGGHRMATGLLAGTAPGPGFEDLQPGATWTIDGGDVVSAAPELARLTLNVAMAHHDRLRPGSQGRRLVYGGHTIAIAAAHAARALPTLATIAAWQHREHLAPVGEGDTLYSRLALERREPLPGGGGLAHLRSLVHAIDERGARRDVLDWRFVAVLA